MPSKRGTSSSSGATTMWHSWKEGALRHNQRLSSIMSIFHLLCQEVEDLLTALLTCKTASGKRSMVWYGMMHKGGRVIAYLLLTYHFYLCLTYVCTRRFMKKISSLEFVSIKCLFYYVTVNCSDACTSGLYNPVGKTLKNNVVFGSKNI